MDNAATRPTTAPEMVHPFKPLPRVDVHVDEVADGTPEFVDLGVAPWGRSLVEFINRIGCPSIVPGPASGVPKRK
jgi:hypothetical protein